MASSVTWRTPLEVTEVSARLAKVFDPGQQCCIGGWINVQKFDAHSHLWFHHTHHCQRLYLFGFVGERSADPGSDLQRVARTHETLSERKSLCHPVHTTPGLQFQHLDFIRESIS